MRPAFLYCLVQTWTADPHRQAQHDAPAPALAPAAALSGACAIARFVAGRQQAIPVPGRPRVIASRRLASRQPIWPMEEGKEAAE